MRHRILLSVLVAVAAGCANEVSGPAPTVSSADSGDAAATEPSFVCNEQVETWVTVRGTDFSPLVVDALDKDVPTTAVNPTVTLSLQKTPEGDSADSRATVVLDNDSDVRVRWFDSEELRIFVDPSLELLPGIYDLTVANANGEQATKRDAFGVLPRPTVTGLVPAFMCLAQGGKAMLVEGDHFLIDGAAGLPSVQVGDKTYEPTASDGCRDLGAPFGDHQLCTNLTIELADMDFEPSVQDVTVTNLEPAACVSDAESDGSELLVVPPPVVNEIVDDLTCLAQGERMFVISGTDMVAYGGASPTADIGGVTFDTVAMGCEEVSVFGDSFERCTSVELTIGQDGLPVGAHDISVLNPEPADCSSVDGLQLTVVPPPSIANVAPEVLCSEQLDNDVLISGGDFYTVDGTAPSVTIGANTYDSVASDCAAVATVVNHDVTVCTTLTVTVPAGDLMPGQQDVVVTNPAPAGCSSSEPVALTFVPPPEVTAIVEEYNCIETRDISVRVEGSGFLEIGGVQPTVTIAGTPVTIASVEGCTAVAGTMNVQSCTALVIDVPQGSLPNGLNDVVVTNPDPAACFSEEPAALELYPAPVITTAEPPLFCTDAGDATVRVNGDNFYVVNGTGPSVMLGGQMFATTPDATTCMPTGRAGLQVCTAIDVTVPQGGLGTGDATIEIVNPEPVACTAIPGSILVGGPPNIAMMSPGGICGGDVFDGNVTFTGDTFLRVDGTTTAVTVQGQSIPATLSNCTAVAHPTLTVETCTELSVVVPVALRGADMSFELTNPPPIDCGSVTRDLVYADDPLVTTVTPLRICDSGATIQVDGTGFDQDLVVTLGGVPAQMVTVNAAGTSATAVFGQTMAGLQTLEVINASTTCNGTFATPIDIIPGPQAFFVDPPVLYSEVSTQVTIYLTGLQGGTVTMVEVVDSNGNATALQNMTFDPNDPNRVQGVIPAGTLDPNIDTDTFDVVITDDIACAETAADLVTITRTPTIALQAIDPPFGQVGNATSVAISATDPPPAGQVALTATPRAYLNPSAPQPGDLATELAGVQFIDSFQLNGVVPDNLPVGTYDVIVINPDGTVGILPAAFDVTTDPPPTVDTVSPGSWETNVAAWPITIEGANFVSPTVEVECLDPSGNTDVAVVTTTGSTSTQVDATVDTTSLDHLSVCVVRVTNADGTYGELAPITVTNPAGNFVEFSNGPNLNVARRGLSLGQGRATRTARFIYAIGGDDGDAANPMDSIEAAALNRFGAPGPWVNLTQALPAPRTLGRATRVGDFVYMLGGHDGTSAVGTVSRARVLDPLETTQITNVEFDIDLTMTGGLAPGVYYYRVAPVLGPADPVHPDGELLASERQPVRVPFAGIDLEVTWNAYPGAVAYRVYRSPMPDAPAGTEELLVEVPSSETTITDDGGTPTSAQLAMPLGSLSVWQDVAALATPRHSFGSDVVEDPATPGLFHIFLAGGVDAAGMNLGSVERLSVTVNGPADQTVDATGTTLTAVLSVPRSELSLVIGTEQNASLLTTPTLYALGGRDDSGMGFTRTTEYAELQVGGDISAFTVTLDLQRSRAGYAAAVANNNIVAACGQGGNPSSTADKMSISMITPPELDASSSLGGTGSLGDRYLMGSTSFSGLMYVAGGEGSNAPATNTVDYSILGGTP